MVFRRQLETGEAEMKLTSLLGQLDITLSELDALTKECGCCYANELQDRENFWGLISEIEGYRFLLDI